MGCATMETTNREFKKGQTGLLETAHKILHDIGIRSTGTLRDKKGEFAKEYCSWFLIANKSIFENTWISADEKLIERCLKKRKKLLVYIGQDDEFYLYDPNDIMRENWPNERGYLNMLNWNYTIGKLVFEGRKNVNRSNL